MGSKNAAVCVSAGLRGHKASARLPLKNTQFFSTTPERTHVTDTSCFSGFESKRLQPEDSLTLPHGNQRGPEEEEEEKEEEEKEDREETIER